VQAAGPGTCDGPTGDSSGIVCDALARRLHFRAGEISCGGGCMICPDCGYDNIDGVDTCEACGQPLVQFDPSGSELEQSITRHSIQVLCPPTPISIGADATVREAIKMMVDNRIGCLLVEENGQLAGVFTERDVLNKIALERSNLDAALCNFMTRSPETITGRDSIAYALHAMDIGGYRHIPIVSDSRKPTGIISVRDILRFLCARFAQLRPQAK
jgi:CBS domain-containing protein